MFALGLLLNLLQAYTATKEKKKILKGSLNRILCKMSYLAQLGFIDMCLPNTAFTKRQNIHNININNNNHNHNHE